MIGYRQRKCLTWFIYQAAVGAVGAAIEGQRIANNLSETVQKEQGPPPEYDYVGPEISTAAPVMDNTVNGVI